MAQSQPRPGNSRLITPSIYGRLRNNSWDVGDLPIPKGRWMEWKDRNVERSQNALHLDEAHAKSIRRAYGYVGQIKALRTKRSANTDSPFLLLTAVVKISSPENGDFTADSNRSICFARVGAFASNWAPRFRDDNAANFMLGDLIEGVVLAPPSSEYRCANLCSWRRASVKEWKRFAHSSVFGQGEIELGADSVFNLPILGPSNFSRYVNEDENVFTCCARHPLLEKTVLEMKSRQKGRLSRLYEESLFGGVVDSGVWSPSPREGLYFNTYWY